MTLRTSANVIRRMAEEGKQKLSPNFLAAHGPRKRKAGLHLLRKNLVMVKLENVAQEIGLKSP